MVSPLTAPLSQTFGASAAAVIDPDAIHARHTLRTSTAGAGRGWVARYPTAALTTAARFMNGFPTAVALTVGSNDVRLPAGVKYTLAENGTLPAHASGLHLRCFLRGRIPPGSDRPAAVSVCRQFDFRGPREQR